MKKARKSKTLNFAGLLAILGAVQLTLPEVRALVSPEVYGWGLVAIGAIVAWLRFVTTDAIGVGK